VARQRTDECGRPALASLALLAVRFHPRTQDCPDRTLVGDTNRIKMSDPREIDSSERAIEGGFLHSNSF
jgi:hypothetical protein